MDVAYRSTKNGSDQKYLYPQMSGWKAEAKKPLGSPRLRCKRNMELFFDMELGLKRKHVRRTYEI
jgi:hypothetical protein